ncbi:hypothetical protein [Paraliobacillus zengyii]|uniref:hypothetical protein n=1 Tax=Paraliobacillus zengyii TaxID=2213194 RepID=UPI000DD46E86|nr:hypothetical protein [Paraliobacillus zengyii]
MNRFKIGLSFFLICFMFFIVVDSISASTDSTIENKLLNREVVDVTQEDGNIKTIYEELPNTFSTSTPLNLTKESNNIGILCATCYHYDYTKISSSIADYDYKFGWHPDFNGYTRADTYWFSSSTTNFSFSLSYGVVGIAVARGGGSGFSVDADYDRWSRPAVYGRLVLDRFEVKKYNSSGTLLDTYYETVPTSQRTYIKVLYR